LFRAERDCALIPAASCEVFARRNKVSGIVTFTLENNVMYIKGTITGLKPGKHGIHIHEFGNFSKNNATSSGGHFNPNKEMHGDLTNEHRHAGDL